MKKNPDDYPDYAALAPGLPLAKECSTRSVTGKGWGYLPTPRYSSWVGWWRVRYLPNLEAVIAKFLFGDIKNALNMPVARDQS